MELLLIIPLAIAAAGLYWLFKPPFSAEGPIQNPEQPHIVPIVTENETGAVATVHAAPIMMKESAGE